MRSELLEFLQCPSCQGALRCEPSVVEGPHVMEGLLRCGACAEAYPIRRGVPRCAQFQLSGTAKRTAAVFGDQWRRSPQLEQFYAKQLRDWLGPLELEELCGQRVLDAGCGKGRHVRVFAEQGAQAVVGVDLSDSVELAFEHTKDLPNAHIVQADLTRLPLVPAVFDAVVSIGVVHHLTDPSQGVDALAQALRPGGRLGMWVYGRESNDWVQAIRRWTAWLRHPTWPHGMLWTLSALPATILFLGLRGGLTPMNRWAKAWVRRIPYHEYLLSIREFPWRELRVIVHDQLAAPVAHYVAKDEVDRWLTHAGLSEIRLEWVHGNSWAGLARRPLVPSDVSHAGMTAQGGAAGP